VPTHERLTMKMLEGKPGTRLPERLAELRMFGDNRELSGGTLRGTPGCKHPVLE